MFSIFSCACWPLGCMYLFELVFSSNIYSGMELLVHMVILFLDFFFFEKSPYYFPQCLHQSTFPLTVYKHSLLGLLRGKKYAKLNEKFCL